MESLSVQLFQRIGLLLVLAFIMTRIPAFRYLLDRKRNLRTICSSAALFGVFGMISIETGVLVQNGVIMQHSIITSLGHTGTLVGPALVAIVIAGLFGGPIVGVLAGAITSGFVFVLGGPHLLADICIHPITGLLSGLTARFFSQERVIASQKAMFIGMFAPVLHMGLWLIFTADPLETIAEVNQIGLPLVVTNSVAIAVFTAMIHVVLVEQEQAAAMETQRALKIAEQALPHLRRGLNMETAEAIARLLYSELKIAAVSITDNRLVLAYVGIGSDHYQRGQRLQTKLSRIALESGQLQVAINHQEIQCDHVECPIHAAIMVPLSQSGETVGLINLYFQRAQQLRAVEINLALGLGKLMSVQLDVVAAEQLKELTRSVKLRHLQAQIQPHFLFNTLQMISTLIRVDPSLARHVTVQLGHFMRLNLRTSNHAVIPLGQELDHLKAYLEIINIRFSDKFKIRCEVPQMLKPAVIPPFTLQPLVENSIKHGLKDKLIGGEILIQITTQNSYFEIQVEDNGQGIPAELIEKLGHEPIDNSSGAGIGLFNLNQRLIGLVGNLSALHFSTGPAGGCVVFFQIPMVN